MDDIERGTPRTELEPSTHQCPVCEYPGLKTPPCATWPPPAGLEIQPPYEDTLGVPSYEVCPQCGFEFGNDDNPGTAEPVSFESYRADWERKGSQTFDPVLIAGRSLDQAATRR
jgi:hypothetical protein